MVDERFLTVPEVADLLRVKPETVRRLLRKGRLRGVAISDRGGYRIAASEIDRFFRDGGRAPAPSKAPR